MRVSDVLGDTPRALVTAAGRDTIADVVDLLKEYSIGAVVVSDDGKTLSGIISERDIVRHLSREQEGTLRLPVEELMTVNVLSCDGDTDIDDAMTTMTTGRFRHLPVLDANGHLSSMVSLGDLVTAQLNMLKEQNEKLRAATGNAGA